MSALKEKYQQQNELSRSKANLMIADFLIHLDHIKKTGYITENEFQMIKNSIFNCKVNTIISKDIIHKDLNNWIVFLKIGLIDRNTFCNEIKNILAYNYKNSLELLSDDAPIKNHIINLSEVGCKITDKTISQNRITVVMKKGQYIITIIRYKSFFWREWKKKAHITDINGNKYNYSIADFYNVVARI